MKKVISATLLSFSLALWSCHTEKQPVQPASSDITGLASPVKLRHDTTLVRLKNYFEDLSKVGKIAVENQAVNVNSEGYAVVPPGLLRYSVGNMKVEYNGFPYDIPVFRSEKVNYTFTYNGEPDAKTVGMAGSMNGWNYKATSLQRAEQGWTVTMILDPGVYEYRIWADGREKLDETNPATKENGMGGLNNIFTVGNPSEKSPFIQTISVQENQLVIAIPRDLPAVFAYLDNQQMKAARSGEELRIDLNGISSSNGVIRIFGGSAHKRSNDLYIPLRNGRPVDKNTDIHRKDFHGAVMYFMMVDRFHNGNPANDRPTPDSSILPQANNLGGDLEGIIEKIESGYFSNLGINTIWVSPISRNAEGAWGLWDKGVTSKFSAYHGYWPTALKAVDDRFGSEESFRKLIDAAHAHQMNVILDYVAHHVHQDHPLIKVHPDWSTPLYLPDGTMNTEKWDEHRLTTWFDTFLPTWDFSKPEVVHALTDTAMYWVDEYDLDGFRHDATKHIPEEFWQELTAKIKARKDKRLFQIGETYGNPELIGSYINSGQLDAQFDFNMYDAMVDAFAREESSLLNLAAKLQEGLYHYGSHHLMGNITGNQDRARFISYADGSIAFSDDPKLAGWTRNIQNRDNVGFRRLEMLNAFMLSTPGIPCIYYGDEIGIPGGNDPDNRRMMVFEGWNDQQKQLYSNIQKLIQARNTNAALVYGDTEILYSGEKCLIIQRSYFDKTAVLVIAKDGRSGDITVNLNRHVRTDHLKAAFESGDIRMENGQLIVPAKSTTLSAHGYQLFY